MEVLLCAGVSSSFFDIRKHFYQGLHEVQRLCLDCGKDALDLETERCLDIPK